MFDIIFGQFFASEVKVTVIAPSPQGYLNLCKSITVVAAAVSSNTKGFLLFAGLSTHLQRHCSGRRLIFGRHFRIFCFYCRESELTLMKELESYSQVNL